MTVKEAAREEWAKLKDQPLSAKLKYIFTYYGIGIAAGAAVLVIAVSLLISNLTAKEQVLQLCLLNVGENGYASEQFRQSFMTHGQIDPQQQEVSVFTAAYDLDSPAVDSTYATTQMIMARVSAAELDIFGADEKNFSAFAYNEFLADLSQVLTPEQLSRWSDRLVYMDRALLEQSDDQQTADQLPDPYRPEDMTDPIPVGIRLNSNSKLAGAYTLPEGDFIIGVFSNSQHQSMVLTFLEYILE